MIKITDNSQCTGCSACFSVCSQKAISMEHDEYGQIYPQVSQELCTNCGLCEKICPLLHKDRIPGDVNLQALEVKAVYNKDEEVRRRSTSGGFFSLLAANVIDRGGAVCAARFDDHFHIHHALFDSMDQIDPFRGSKYAQSDLGNVFQQIKEYLKTRPVLFVGTPCQVAGLKSYLIKDYDNLITCDFICMCISSGKMWDEYISDYQNKHKIKRIFFKDKRIGWHKGDWRMLIEDEQGEHFWKGVENPFFNSYLKHYSARPSCFSCAFRHCRRMSDFTISDCWGIDTVNPGFDDNKGCTSLIIQSEKGKRAFEEIKSKANYQDYSISNVCQYNRHIKIQASVPQGYDQFCRDYKSFGFAYAANNVLPKRGLGRIIKRLKSIIKRGIK